MNSDIILTGPPRSGTTLTCFLLNKVKDTIALNEPMNLKMFPNKHEGTIRTQQFFNEMRTSLLANRTAIARQVEGKIPDNIFPTHQSEGSALRKNIATKGRVHFDKELSPNFILILKHNAHFTFLLDQLIDKYSCYAIIRNPLATIASWNTINAPVSRGNLNVLQTLDSTLYNHIESIPNLIDRQVFLLHNLFDCYANLAPENIIKYEHIVKTKGKCLSTISADAQNINEDLINKNESGLYNKKQIQEIKTKLLVSDGAFWKFYSKDDVEKLYLN